MIAVERCPICTRDPRAPPQYLDAGAEWRISCHRCGTYRISYVLERTLPSSIEKSGIRFLSAHLSAHTRQNFEQGIEIVLNEENWRSFAEAHSKTSVTQKLNRCLKLVADKSAFPGDHARIIHEDFPLVDAQSIEEFWYLLGQLKNAGYLEFVAVGTGVRTSECLVAAEGWEKLEAHDVAGVPGRCFVAMYFDHSLDDAWEKGIYPALHDDCSLDPIRIDLMHHNEKICDKILGEIRRSEFLVADFTGHRAGVYFEAGFALGLGRPVIWTCRKDELGKTHFDTRQYNHIDWENPADLRARLRDRVIATIPKPNPRSTS